MTSRHLRHLLATVVLGLLGAACSTQDSLTAPAELAAPAGRVRRSLSAGGGDLNRLACPTAETHALTGVIGPAGGTLSVYGFRVDFPAGAVPVARLFTLRVLAGAYFTIDGSADGLGHYEFAVPVNVTVDLARCGAVPASIGAWYLDPTTGELVENMGGKFDPQTNTLRFTTPHFSGYSVAW